MGTSVRPDPLDAAWQQSQQKPKVDPLDSAWNAAQSKPDPLDEAFASARSADRMAEDEAEHAPPVAPTAPPRSVEITEPSMQPFTVQFQPDRGPAARLADDAAALRRATAGKTTAPADAVRPTSPNDGKSVLDVLTRDVSKSINPTDEQLAMPKSTVGKAAFMAGRMAAHPVETATSVVLAPAQAAFTLGEFTRQEMQKDYWRQHPDEARANGFAVDQTGPMATPGKDVVSPREAAFAAGQLLVPEAVGHALPALERIFGASMANATIEAVRAGKSPAQALLIGYAKRNVAHMAAGAAIGAVYSPDDPEVGALLGAAIGGAHAAMQAPKVRVPADVIQGRAPIDVSQRVGTPTRRGEARVATDAEAPAGPDFTVEQNPEPPAPPAAPDHQLMSPERAEVERRAENYREQRDLARRAAETDDLTGLGNKAALSRAKAAVDADPTLGWVAFDGKNFKAVNDVHGHSTGDAVLQHFAEAVNAAARELGVPVRTFRPGGDEFAAAVPADKIDAFTKRAVELSRANIGDVQTELRASSGSTLEEADQGLTIGKRKAETPGEREARVQAEIDAALGQTSPNTAEQPPTPSEATLQHDRATEAEARPEATQPPTGADQSGGVRSPALPEEARADRGHGEPEGRAGTPPELKSRHEVRGPVGRDSSVFLSDGRTVKTKYRIVDASEVQPSHDPQTFNPNPLYPEGIQGRAYHGSRGTAARQQVELETGKLRPEVLLDAGSGLTDGPPLITPHGIVVAGNQRSMMLRRAATNAPEVYAKYREQLEARAPEFGVSREQVAAMKSPLLVRQINDPSVDVDSPAALGELNRISDQAPTKTKDQVTAAMSRAKAIQGATSALDHLSETLDPDGTVRDYLGTNAGRDFVRHLVADGVISTPELPQFVDRATNTVHAIGKQQIEDMLYAAAIGDADVMARAPADALRKLGPSIPALVSASRTGPYSLEKDLQGALDILSSSAAMRDEAGSGKRSVKDFLDQSDMFGRSHTEFAADLARFIEARSATDVAKAIRTYAKLANEAKNQSASYDAFGDSPVSPEDLRGKTFASPSVAQRKGGGGRQGFPAPPQDGPDLFGNEPPAQQKQNSLFGEGAGTTTSRSLAASERAARAELERLRDVQRLATSPSERRRAAARIAELERLVNRDKAISADELATRAAAGEERLASIEAGGDEPDEVGAPTKAEVDEIMSQESGTKPTDRPPDPLRDDNVFGAPEAIYRSMAGELNTPADAGRLVSAPEIINALADVTEAAGKRIVQRVGRTGMGRRVLGWWNPRTHVIRTRNANDIPTAAHEVAHAIETLIYGRPKGSPWKPPIASQAMQRELVQMGRALYGGIKPAGGYKREGWAEFVRMWITESSLGGGPAEVKLIAPLVYDWFENDFSKQYPDVRKEMEKARELTRQWRKQGSIGRAKASVIDPLAPSARIKGVGRSLRHLVSFEKWVEMAEPLDKLAREAEANLGRSLRPSEDPFFTLSALRSTHSSRTKYMVETAMIDLAGNRVGPSLSEITPLVAGKKWDFTIYLWARRTLALATDPNGPRASGLSVQDARQIIDELDTPGFQLAASKVYDWNNAVLNYAAQASPTFAEVVNRVRARDPGNYIPLQREFTELDDMWSRVQSRAGATKQSPVKRLRGSDRRVKDIFPVMIAQTEKTLRQAHERAVLDQIMRLAQAPGMGHIIEEVPPDQVPVAAASVGELIDRINRQIFDADPGAEMLDASKLDTDLLGQFVTFYAPAQRPKGQDPIVPLYDQGKVRWFYVQGDLYDALKSLDVYQLSSPSKGMNFLIQLLAEQPAQMMRAGTTGLRASFGLVWNPLRDLPTFAMNTRGTKNGAKLLSEWGRSFAEMAMSRTGGKNSEWVDAWIRLGGEMAQSLGQDIPHTRRAARRLFESKTTRTLDPRNWFDFYRELIQFPEGAPRVAELRMVARQIGWQPGQPMTLDQSFDLLLASKQVTTDFTAAGEWARFWNRLVPFHNAAIQGPRANLRAMRRNPALFAWRVFQLAAVTLLLWWKNKDEEWYQSMDLRERFLNWHIPFEHDGREELARIPRPFEVGLIGGALPEMLLDSWYRHEPDEATAWFKAFNEIVVPDFTPVLPRIASEQMQNKQFQGRPIVPQSEAQRPAAEQFNEYTSRVAINLGDIFDVSPMRIDHVMNALGGPVTGDVLSVLGLGTPELDRQKELADAPLVGRLFQRGGRLGSQPREIRQLFEARDSASTVHYSKRNPETPEGAKKRLLLNDAAEAVSAYLNIRRYTATVAKRDELTRMARDAAISALGAARQEDPSRRDFARQRVEAQRARRESQSPP